MNEYITSAAFFFFFNDVGMYLGWSIIRTLFPMGLQLRWAIGESYKCRKKEAEISRLTGVLLIWQYTWLALSVSTTDCSFRGFSYFFLIPKPGEFINLRRGLRSCMITFPKVRGPENRSKFQPVLWWTQFVLTELQPACFLGC